MLWTDVYVYLSFKIDYFDTSPAIFTYGIGMSDGILSIMK